MWKMGATVVRQKGEDTLRKAWLSECHQAHTSSFGSQKIENGDIENIGCRLATIVVKKHVQPPHIEKVPQTLREILTFCSVAAKPEQLLSKHNH